MLHPETSMHAIRLLAVDMANLTTRVAVYQATTEELIELAMTVDERAWEPVLSDDDDEDAPRTVTKVMLPLDQQQALQRILMLINALR
jgi:hypothetical protein